MERTLPAVTAETILATVEQARRSGTPGKFVLEWLEKFASKGQEELCGGIVELVDGFFEDAQGKIHCAAVVGIVLNSVMASIEAKELEELFQETA